LEGKKMNNPIVKVIIKGRTEGDLSHKPLNIIKLLLANSYECYSPDGLDMTTAKVDVKVKRSAGKRAKVKGKSYEDKIGKIIGEWWWGKPFRHSPGSGAWDKQTNDGQILAPGDLVIPKEANCRLIVECKKRKSFPKRFAGFHSLWGWWRKLNDEARMYNKVPLLVFSEDNGIDYVAFGDFFFELEDVDLEAIRVYNGKLYISVAILSEFLKVVEKEDLKEDLSDDKER